MNHSKWSDGNSPSLPDESVNLYFFQHTDVFTELISLLIIIMYFITSIL